MTTPPVPEHSDGEKTRARASRPVETADPAPTPGLDSRGRCSNCREHGHGPAGCLQAHDIAAASETASQPGGLADPGARYEHLKAGLLEQRAEIIQNPRLSRRETEDLKAAVLLLIMHLNHRISDEVSNRG